MNYHQDKKDFNQIKYQQILNKQYHINIHKQKVFESVNNSGLIKMQMNPLLKSSNESNDNINRTKKKLNRVQSIQETNEIESELFPKISDLIGESLKQTDEYRFKIKNSLNEKMSSKSSDRLNEINSTLFKFPQRPKTPIELFGKSNENDLTNLIKSSNLNKSDEINSLIGRYEITNLMNPTNDFTHLNNQINKSFNLLQHFDEYSKYLNLLLNKYFNDNEIYEDIKSKVNCLSLSQQIKDFFKSFSQRYRIIVQVYIQQHLDQSILIASRALWDKTNDSILQKQFFKKNIFILIISFFIYKE